MKDTIYRMGKMKVIKSSEWLVSTNKAGMKKYWKLSIYTDGDNFYTGTTWYQITKTGKKSAEQNSEPYFCAPTNVGRANERNSEQQAAFEFGSILKKQRDRGFRYENEKLDIRPMPMLAHKFKDHAKKVNWPAALQPKLNGMRMLFDGEVGWSRGNKDIIPEVIEHLRFPLGDIILDGELILPGNQLLQETMKAAKKYRPGVSDQLQYHVYDIIDPDMTFAERFAALREIVKHAPANVILVPTVEVRDELEVMTRHKDYVQTDGFEGSMIRTMDSKYEINKRSYSLLKLKDFTDDEFKILEVIEGEGSDRGLAIFVLDNGHGQVFNCRPEGTQENRADLFKDKKSLVGKYLTVRYFELSKDKVPLFPVGVSIREWGEFNDTK